MPKGKFIIGVDFDNTLVNYDDAFHQTALELNLIGAKSDVENKQEIRDFIRSLPGGEIKWQKLQAEVYGKRMALAQMIKGVEDFFRSCKDNDIQTFIVSHKSKYAAQDQEKVDLQKAALAWMKQNRFFEKTGLGLSEDRIYFENLREEKAGRIKKLKCTHFIDDLQEVFLEEAFPKETIKILFSPAAGHVDRRLRQEAVIVFQSWSDIHNHFFQTAGQ